MEWGGFANPDRLVLSSSSAGVRPWSEAQFAHNLSVRFWSVAPGTVPGGSAWSALRVYAHGRDACGPAGGRPAVVPVPSAWVIPLLSKNA